MVILKHNTYKDCLIPVSIFFIFTIIGVIISLFKSSVLYLYLFIGIGLFEMNTRIFVHFFPKFRQKIRLLVQFIIGGFLLIWLGLFKGVNFQFSQLFFDVYQGIVTGVLIQIIVARLILPFFLGNAFCSRACWTGFVFEVTNKNFTNSKLLKRNNYLAFTYMFILILIAVFIIVFWNTEVNDDFKRNWIIVENIAILSMGLVLTFYKGSRAYCRLLCPFLTISSFISPYSFLKIIPINSENCLKCHKCDVICPMLINVSNFVENKKSINNRMCIYCERCVSSCDQGVLKLSNKMIER